MSRPTEITFDALPAKLQDGFLILVPFDNMYALIADARNKSLMETLRKLKGRGKEKGFTILVESDARLNKYVREVPALAWDIIDTSEDSIILVLPEGNNLAENAMAANGTVAVRMVKSTEERKLVQAANGPIACTALLTESGDLAHAIEDADPKVLEAVDYLLTLPTEKLPVATKKIPIIGLGMDGDVRVIRQ